MNGVLTVQYAKGNDVMESLFSGNVGDAQSGRSVDQELPRSQEQRSRRESGRPKTENELKAMIRQMNLKVTDQRMMILKHVAAGRRHISAQELFESVHQERSDIGFATVYRFLKSLTQHGLVTEVRMGGLPARYELDRGKHHDHLSCVECGKIVEFENFAIEKLQEGVAASMGFILTGHVLELYGVCSDCQKTKVK